MTISRHGGPSLRARHWLAAEHQAEATVLAWKIRDVTSDGDALDEGESDDRCHARDARAVGDRGALRTAMRCQDAAPVVLAGELRRRIRSGACSRPSSGGTRRSASRVS